MTPIHLIKSSRERKDAKNKKRLVLRLFILFSEERKEKMIDVTVIGAGVIGAAVAYYLSHYDCKVTVLEKENDVAEGTSIANSGIVHSGHDPHPGTLKARFNVEGNRMYPELCRHLHVLYRQTGAFVVAVSTEETETLKQLKQQAADRGIPCEEMDGEAARKLEPNLSDQVIRVLSLPTTGVVDPWEITLGLMEEAVLNGCELELNEKVTAIKRMEDHYEVTTERDGQQNIRRSRYVVNCAGVHGDDIYRLLAPAAEFRITPRRGEYFVLDNAIQPLVSRPIYPMPSKLGKGILAIPTIHDNVLLGPDSEEITDKENVGTERSRLDFIRQALTKTVKNIPFDKVIRSFAGLRPTGSSGDFVVREEENYPGFIQAIGIESPGLTAAPAIGRYIAEELIGAKEGYPRKENYQNRRPPVRLGGKSLEEKNQYVAADERFGRIICRCESVSEGEIIDCIQRPVGARTVKAVKKRVRPGSGRCQGGFCEPRVVELLARELGVSPLEILYDSGRSPLLAEETKQAKGAEHENG